MVTCVIVEARVFLMLSSSSLERSGITSFTTFVSCSEIVAAMPSNPAASATIFSKFFPSKTPVIAFCAVDDKFPPVASDNVLIRSFPSCIPAPVLRNARIGLPPSATVLTAVPRVVKGIEAPPVATARSPFAILLPRTSFTSPPRPSLVLPSEPTVGFQISASSFLGTPKSNIIVSPVSEFVYSLPQVLPRSSPPSSPFLIISPVGLNSGLLIKNSAAATFSLKYSSYFFPPELTPSWRVPKFTKLPSGS